VRDSPPDERLFFLPSEPERHRHKLHVWAVIGEHLVITCLSKHFEATTADSELKPAACVESWLVSTERRDNLVDGYDSRETDSEERIAKESCNIRRMAHLKPAMIEASSDDHVGLHGTVWRSQFKHGIECERPNVRMPIWLTKIRERGSCQAPLVVSEIQVGQKIARYIQAATEIQIEAGVEVCTRVRRRNCESAAHADIGMVLFRTLLPKDRNPQQYRNDKRTGHIEN
jgi:hypothetical protein